MKENAQIDVFLKRQILNIPRTLTYNVIIYIVHRWLYLRLKALIVYTKYRIHTHHRKKKKNHSKSNVLSHET